MRITIASVAIAAAILRAASAQTPTVDHLTQSQLIEEAQALNAKAHGPDGAASLTLKVYPNHFTMIALRHKDGEAEIHRDYADFFLVVQGQATLVTGGAINDGRTMNPGEIRGTSVQNGIRIALNEGDVVHIPASIPHQLLVPKDGTFIYFVIKVKEK